ANTKGFKKGLLCTLSVILYDISGNLLFLANVGDSRIYCYKKKVWHQLTVDDSYTKIIKINGKIVMENGSPKTIMQISKSLGSNTIDYVDVTELNANDYLYYALLSDGFYGLTGFSSFLDRLANTVDMSSIQASIIEDIQRSFDDDTSCAIVKVNTVDFTGLKPLILSNPETLPLLNHTYTEGLEKELRQSISECNEEYCTRIFEFMQKHSLYFDKSKMINILVQMAKANMNCRFKFTEIIRKM
ncbi:hypothetical protein D9V86_09570, partial [Bacteroidetes/Chlorobi group bacterium ChocPot_Mid]